MRYVYVISLFHGESGSEEVHATLDRSKIAVLFKTHGEDRPEILDSLTSLLERDDAALASRRSGHTLANGWGGPAFFVIPLE